MKRRWLALPVVAALAAVPLLATSPSPVEANHPWSNYHWAWQGGYPFPLKLGDNVSGAWDDRLREASARWNSPTSGDASMLTTAVVEGRSNARRCGAVSGRVEVCNSTYGRNGWLGLATVWVYADGHIAQGTVKLNDTYHNSAPYSSTAWRRLVMCQEIGHTFGLGHVNEAFGPPNTGSCMDYTNEPAGGGDYAQSNEFPNEHDFEQLVAIYSGAHSNRDTRTTVDAAAARSRGVDDEAGDSPGEWGRAIRFDAEGRPILFRRDQAGGVRVFTWVTWALGEGRGNRGEH